MKYYKGFPTGREGFGTPAEIDAYIKACAIRRLRTCSELLRYYLGTGRTAEAMSICAEADKAAERLVNDCGMTWEEVSALEIQLDAL